MRLLLHPDGLRKRGRSASCAEGARALGVREEIADRVLRRESKKDNCFAGLVFEKYEIDPSSRLNATRCCARFPMQATRERRCDR